MFLGKIYLRVLLAPRYIFCYLKQVVFVLLQLRYIFRYLRRVNRVVLSSLRQSILDPDATAKQNL